MTIVESKKTYFELIQIAGEGLNSCVYKALRKDASQTISQVVALKILKSKSSVSSWRQEFSSLLQVNSPYCVKVYDFEWVDEQPALVLEWLDGITLAHLFESAELSETVAREVLLQIQEGLIDLHMAGLCHGDLHMENVFITIEGQIKLLDFGFANVDRFQDQGAPALRAPELSTGGTPNFWSDLYSLGNLAQIIGLNAPELMGENPEDRDLLKGHRNREEAFKLAELILAILKRRKSLAEQKTIPFESKTIHAPINSLFILFGLISLLFFLPHASSHLKTEPICTIEFRTQKWLEVQLEGESPKFAPFQIQTQSCEVLNFSWKTQDREGKMKLTPRPHHIIRLSDKDFR